MTERRRRVVSLLGLVVVVAGIPALLVRFVGWPLPHGWPSPGDVGSALEDGWVPGERFVVGVLAVLVWIIWAQLVRHIVAELADRRRLRSDGLEVTTVPGARTGLTPRVAAWLVGGLMLASPLSASAAPAPPPAIGVMLSATRALDPLVLPAVTPASATTAPVEVASPSYVVRTWEGQRDCLWNIAERNLGEGLRWAELLELNADVAQPSGRLLSEDSQHWVYPGMELRLPADAAGPDLSEVPEPPREVPVAPGDPGPAPGVALPSPDEPQVSEALPPASTPTTVGAAAPRTTPESPSPTGEAPAAPGSVPLGGSGLRVPAALALGLPVFAAGGVALALNRRRRAQVARCRAGHDVVHPDPVLEPLERSIRAIAAEEAAEWIDATLRMLGAQLRESSSPPPQVTCVRAGELGLEILLSEPATDAPAGFDAVDDGHVWRLAPDVELADLARQGGDEVAPLPALVSIGASAEGPVLVDLEALGTLSVEGDPGRVEAFLAGVVLELASAPWAEGTEVVAVGVPPALATLEEVSEWDDPASLLQDLGIRAASVSDALDGRPSTLAARTDGPGEDWLPRVAVVFTASSDGVGSLSSVAGTGSGVAVVGAGPIEGARWRLVVVAEGFARLEPLGLDVRIAGVDGPLATTVDGLDTKAITGAAELLSTASREDDVAPPAESGDDEARGARRPRRPRYEVWVDVLGPVEITGWAEPVGRRPKLEELVAYLATHPERPVMAERLRCAVWAESDVSSKTFVQALSRARRCLGGQVHLPEASAGSYHLGPGVGCSWERFKELAAAAGRARPTDAVELWRQALDLVRGEPFDCVARGTYVWAWSEQLVYEMQVAITRAADALGSLALAADDPDLALWATRRGLVAMPAQLSLFDWEMRVAAHRRDLDGLNLAFDARRRAEQGLDPLAEVPPETVELYERLMAEARAGGRARLAS